jgi:transcriptional regulator with XRE-family HTH domain
MDETFGQRVHRLRVARGVRVPDLACGAGITGGVIRQLESGQTNEVTLIAGLRIARYLEVSPGYLATGIDAEMEASSEIAAVRSRLRAYGRRIAALEGGGTGRCPLGDELE